MTSSTQICYYLHMITTTEMLKFFCVEATSVNYTDWTEKGTLQHVMQQFLFW